ncbi:hypothetical protein B7494_g3683 [Chlorociboria aeruginascens]|nr:hypothetical protein B7494_g3683 [Chlorociboria aeruginascens]
MPYIPHTPEALLARSDSKNPTVTCRGLTANGRPCRRAIAISPHPSPSPSLDLRTAPSPEAFCWQHREQASAPTSPSPQGFQSTAIKERTSVDTLIDRLGILELERQNENRKAKRKPVAGQGQEKRDGQDDAKPPRPSHQSRPKPKPKSNLEELICCIGMADEARRAPRPVRIPERRTTASIPTSRIPTTPHQMLHRPSLARDPLSQTGEFLTLIPPSTSPQTTSLLLAELAKPVSESDEEGYIYMFWLTPESLPAAPPSEAASSLLSPPSRLPPGHRRPSDVLNTFASTPDTPSNTKTILLKIGRAQNVQRRLNQWTRQCGYNLSLIRYYPYQASSSPLRDVDELPRTPRRVPHAHKVERLIHLELNGKRAQGSGKCGSCGREHREWFEVDANRNGVKAIDEVIRRWVEWGERST